MLEQPPQPTLIALLNRTRRTPQTLKTPTKPAHSARQIRLVLQGAVPKPQVCIPDWVVGSVAREPDAGARRRGPVGERGAVGADDELGVFRHDGVGERRPAPAPDVRAAVGRGRDGAHKLGDDDRGGQRQHCLFGRVWSVTSIDKAAMPEDGDDSYQLYDLRVEVVCPPNERIMCGAKPGDHFTLQGEMLYLPPGQGFSIYSLGECHIQKSEPLLTTIAV